MPSFHTLSLLAAVLSSTQVQAIVLPRQGSAGVTTRYWDCCKASCSWSGKAAFSSPVTSCDKDDNPLTDPNAVNGCPELGDGTAYTCSNQQSYAVNDDLAYGFAAVSGGDEADTCCACYKLTFSSEAAAGKTMIVQATNIGYDVGALQFDLAIPGGGVGAFPKGCAKQYNAPANGWGSLGAYGGTASRSECDALPAKLRDGCYFRFDWMMGSNNPSVEYERVACPADLVAKSQCKRDDDGKYPSVDTGSPSTSATASKTSTTATQTSTSTSTTSTEVPTSATSTEAPVPTSSTEAPAPTTTTKAPASTTFTKAPVPTTTTKAPATTTTTKAPATTTTTKAPVHTTSTNVPASKTSTKAPTSTVSTEAPTSTTAPTEQDPDDGDDDCTCPASYEDATQEIYGQCGGQSWTGPTDCGSDAKCVVQNEWYSQCQPQA